MLATIRTTQDPDPTREPDEWRDQFIKELRSLDGKGRQIVHAIVYFLAWQGGTLQDPEPTFLKHIGLIVRGAFWIVRLEGWKA